MIVIVCVDNQLLDYRTFTYSYLLADSATGEAVIIDPVYEQADRDVKLVKDLGLNLIFGSKSHEIQLDFTACRKTSIASAVYVTACPSVCPSHSSIVSKRGNAEGCGVQHWVA